MSRAFAVACIVITMQTAHAETAPMSFAIASNVVNKPADETALQQMLDAIGRDRNTSFIVYDGNLKSEAEPCRDTLYNTRQQIFDSSRKPVVLLPGGNDWASCNMSQAGGYDPVERLDFIRQLFFGDSNSLGQTPISMIRESDVARFRPFRENVRWQANGIAFIGLNAPAPNNHYSTAGGRNGEFEDRSVANAFWLEHAVENARRSDLRAVVVILQGDPDFARYERRDRFAWLRFSRGDASRDGFLELKRSLVKAAESFRGPMIVIHNSDTPIAKGFRIDQPLRNDKGAVVGNLTRIAIGLKNPQSQWLEVESDLNWRPPFRVRVRDVTIRPNSQAQGSAQGSAPAASSMPSVENGAPGPSSFSQQMQPVQQYPAPASASDGAASNAVPQMPPLINSNPPPTMPPILGTPSNVPTPASGASTPASPVQ
ncbi:hypothetical protein ASG35_02985 [Burkholderia sp. Leaf177]|nr:hypothetical protein ASG35_02985 [Burkholderia sp. Leaf177]